MKMMLRGAAVVACLFTSALLPPSAIAASSGGGGDDGGGHRDCPPDTPSEILALTITDNAVIDLLTRTVTISGTVACTAGVRYVGHDCSPNVKATATLTVLADQQWGNHEASNSPDGSVNVLPGACTGDPHDWSITVVSTTNDDFKPGIPATIQATISAFLESGEAQATLKFQPSAP